MDQQAPAGWEFFDSADFPADTQQDPLARAPLRHVVTAVVVAHNGAEWLPRLTEALWALGRRPDRLIAVDTGSADDTAALLADLPSVERIVSTSGRTGYGAAITRGIEAVGYAPVPLSPYGDDGIPVVEWLWLLHDDCAPAPTALEHLLLQASMSPDVGVWGPKLRTWPRDRALLEVGVTTSLGGRRDTGIEPGEFDQGQHDKVRDVLAVSSAGMLVRRDVWEHLNGFDPRLPIFRDDIDFGWRCHRAGVRVMVAPDSVVYHAQAAASGEREMAGTRRHVYQIDRAHAYYTILANAPGRLIPLLMLRMLAGTSVRSLWFLLGKTPSGAVDEWTALLGVLLAGGWMRARRDRRNLRARPYEHYKRLFSKSVHTIRHNLEETGSAISERLRDAWADEDEEPAPQPTGARRARTASTVAEDQPQWRRQVVRRPFLVTSAALIVFAAIAAREVIGSGVLRSSMLLPPHDSLGDLWRAAATAPAGVTPPAWLGQFGGLATVLFGSPSLAADLVLLAVVPLSAWSAWTFLRRIVLNRHARAWGAAAYGLAVVANGAVQQGRIGTCIAALLLPQLASAVHTILRHRRVAQQGSWRAAWFTGAVLAVLVAFTPGLGALVVVLLLLAAIFVVRRNRRQGRQLLFAIVLGLGLVLPWTIELAKHPSRLGQEAGGTPTAAVGPGNSLAHLLTAVPDAPGTIWWLSVPLVVVAVLSLLRPTRHRFEVAGWAIAVAGLVATLVSSRLGGGSGPLMLLTTAGWICVVTVVWGEQRRVTGGFVRGAIGLVLAATIATAGFWLVRGDDGPLRRQLPQDLPAYLVAAQQPPQDAAIVVVRQDADGATRFAVVRDGGPRMGAIEAEAPASASRPISSVLAALGGGGVGDEADRLAALGIDYVYLAPPVDPGLVATLDTVPGLTRSSAEEGGAAWLVDVEGVKAQLHPDVVHKGWRLAALLAWLVTLVFCLPTARRSVAPAGSHMRRQP
jgi:GT2 family glycosyltransferase